MTAEESSNSLEESSSFNDKETPKVKLTEVINAINPEMNLPECLKGQYKNDMFFKIIAEKPTSFPNFKVVDELMFMNTDGKRLLCVQDIMINSKKVRMSLLRTCHGSRGVFGEVIDQRPVIGQAKCHASREDWYLRPEQL